MEITISQPYSFCQIGRRGNQEDARYPDKDAPVGTKPAFVVCDGVGGQDKGEVASRTVADAIGGYMEDVDLEHPFSGEDFSRVLDHAYNRLNDAMTSDTREMATTMTFVCFHSGGVFCAHMGDSRIYHIRPGVGILYRSEDHSLVNALVHSGNLTPEEAIDHPHSNIITRCMTYVAEGEERPGATAAQITDIAEGDYFFLCTDGVIHKLPEEHLCEILSTEQTDEEKLKTIAEISKDGNDNNTAYLIGIREVTGKTDTDISENSEEEIDKAGTCMTEKLDASIESEEVRPALAKRKGIFGRIFSALFGLQG